MSMVMGSPFVPRGPVHAAGVTLSAVSGGAVVANGVAGAGSDGSGSPIFRRATTVARHVERASRSRNLPCGSPKLAWPYAVMRKASARP